MSDDDRIDRAERIRNMRQGSRGTERTDDDESSSDEETDDGATSEPADDTGQSVDSTAETGVTTGGSSTAESTTAATAKTSDSGTETGQSEEFTDDQLLGGESTATESSVTADEDDDAAAVAQRAAAAAAETMGGDSGTVDQSAAAGGSPQIKGAEGVALPDRELLEAAMASSEADAVDGAARAAAGHDESTATEEKVRVLEFALGGEYYCIDIEYVEEIVKRDAVTRVPNTPDFVDGVVDLRGQITTILEPKEMMDIENEGEQGLIIVFDPDQFEDHGAIGWVVDEVRQVVPVGESEVNSPPVDDEYINGVVDREEYDQFVIWIEPDDALEQASVDDES